MPPFIYQLTPGRKGPHRLTGRTNGSKDNRLYSFTSTSPQLPDAPRTVKLCYG